MPTLLETVTAANAQVARNIADVRAAMPGVQAALTDAVLANPGTVEAVCASLVRDAQKPGGKPVSVAMVDQVLAAECVELSDRFFIKEIMIKRGQVRP